MQLDEGEAEVIVLADEMKADLVIMDERAGTTIIRAKLKSEVTGTIGILIMAKDIGLISQIRPLLDKMCQKGFWIDDDIYQLALNEAGEI